jgi:hypothetical protein
MFSLSRIVNVHSRITEFSLPAVASVQAQITENNVHKIDKWLGRRKLHSNILICFYANLFHEFFLGLGPGLQDAV